MEEEICKLPEWYKNILGLDFNRVITNPEQIKAILDSMRERGKVLEWGKGTKYNVLDYEDSPYLSFKPFPKVLEIYTIVIIEFYPDNNRTLYYCSTDLSGFKLIYATDIDFTHGGKITPWLEKKLQKEKDDRAKKIDSLMIQLGELDWYEENIKENWK